MKKLLFLAASLLLIARCGGSEELPPRSRQQMIERIRVAVNSVASEYGNPVFTEIFTNEPARAAVIRNRLMELERMASLQEQITTLETRLAKVTSELQAKSTASGALVNARPTPRVVAQQPEPRLSQTMVTVPAVLRN